MKHLTAKTTALFLFCILTANGQGDFKPGFIITNDNIEVKGYLDIKDWNSNTQKVFFRESDTSAVFSLAPGDIKAFKSENDYFVTAEVDIETSPDNIDDLLSSLYTLDAVHKAAFYQANRVAIEKVYPQGEIRYRSENEIVTLEPKNERATVFLQLLATGMNVNLFYFRDRSDKDHYYISNTPGKYEELYSIFYADNSKAVMILVYEVEYFKPILLKYLGGDPALEKKILKMNLTRKNLKDLLLEYGSPEGESSVNYVAKEERWKYRYGVQAAVGLTHFYCQEGMVGHDELGQIDFGYDPSVMAGGFAEIIFPGARGHFSVYNELAFRWNRLSGKAWEKPVMEDTLYYSAEFNMAYLRYTPMIRYNFGKGDFRQFIGAGLAFSFILNDSNTLSVTQNNITEINPAISKMKKGEQALCAGTGVIYKSISLEARYEYGNGYSDYLNLNSWTHTFFMVFSYGF